MPSPFCRERPWRAQLAVPRTISLRPARTPVPALVQATWRCAQLSPIYPQEARALPPFLCIMQCACEMCALRVRGEPARDRAKLRCVCDLCTRSFIYDHTSMAKEQPSSPESAFFCDTCAPKVVGAQTKLALCASDSGGVFPAARCFITCAPVTPSVTPCHSCSLGRSGNADVRCTEAAPSQRLAEYVQVSAAPSGSRAPVEWCHKRPLA